MIDLANLKNTSRPHKNCKCLGRGSSSGHGKTCCRGNKGYGSRGGFRKRYGYEGGQMRLFKKLPCRGFTRGMFLLPHFSLNLDDINKFFSDGEVVSLQSLQEKGLAKRRLPGGLKILSRGEIEKKVSIEAKGFSKEAIRKLEEKKISFKVLG